MVILEGADPIMRKLTLSQEDYKKFRDLLIKDLDRQLKRKDAQEISLKTSLKQVGAYKLPETHRPLLIFNSEAWLKLTMLVSQESDEFAVHATVTRRKNEFFITDILCYPQDVTSVTVNATDDYGPWLHQLDEDTFKSLRMQIHSHVHMGPSPSGTDHEMYNKILQGIKDFYIFMIINKQHKVWTNIYDIEADFLYEDDDIDYMVQMDDGSDMTEWIKAQTKHIIRPKTTYKRATYTGGSWEEYDYEPHQTQRTVRPYKGR